jgi:hypothetical protein
MKHLIWALFLALVLIGSPTGALPFAPQTPTKQTQGNPDVIWQIPGVVRSLRPYPGTVTRSSCSRKAREFEGMHDWQVSGSL